MEIRRQIGDKPGEAESLTQLGGAYLSAGNPEKARASLTAGVELFRELRDMRGEAAALNRLGEAQELLGERDAARQTYEQALTAARSSENRREVSSILNNLGMYFYRAGDSETALRRFEEALPLMQAENYQQGQAVVINNMGLAQEALGDKRKAAEAYTSLLSVVQALGDPQVEAAVRSNLGSIFWDLGEAEKALAQHQRALAIWKQTGQVAYQGTGLNNLGAVYESLGELALALDYFNQSLVLRRATKDRRGEATTLTNMGNIFARQKDFRQALEVQQEALARMREVKDRRNEAGVLHNLAKLYAASGDARKALEVYGQAVALRREIGDALGLSISLNNLGTTYRSLGGESEKAKGAYAESLALAREIGDRPGEAVTRLGLSRLFQQQGDLAAAGSEIQQAIELLESRRSVTNSHNLRTAFFVALREYYEQYLDLLFAQRKPEPLADRDARSLEVSERARSRDLLDTLLEARAEIRRGADPVLLESEDGLQRQVNVKELEWQRSLREGTPQHAEALKRDLDVLLLQLDTVRANIRASSPRYAALTQPEPPRAADIQANLGPATLLLSYFLGESKSFLWAVTRSSLSARELPPRAEIEAAARDLHRLLSQSDQRLARAPTLKAAARLSALVLGPVKELLGKDERLVVVADGALHYVPFAALPVPGTAVPLVVEHEIVYLPSASALTLLRRERKEHGAPVRQVAVLADPVFLPSDPRVGSTPAEPSDVARLEPAAQAVRRAAGDVGLESFPRLPFTRQEAEEIASLLPKGEVLKVLDFAASKEVVFGGELAGSRIVHFATHGLLDTRRPELSGLVLSLVDREGHPRDGFLRLHEIYNLDLPCDLVVLSGCETALGKEVRGEGLIALTRGFMYAGAPAVMASLWQVDDRSTGELMRRFYAGLLRQGLSAPAALRAAQVSLWKDKATAAPYFWAGFVFQGDWRSSADSK